MTRQWFAEGVQVYEDAAKERFFEGVQSDQNQGTLAGRTADLAVTLGALTASAAATHPDTADAAVTLGAATLAASGTNAVAAALVQTLGGLVAAAAGTHPVTADLGVTLGACTLSAQAGAPVADDFTNARVFAFAPRSLSAAFAGRRTKGVFAPRSLSGALPRPVP